jgi:hypothetical protein
MNDMAPKIPHENMSAVAAEPTTNSTGKLIRAKDFLACFRQDPDDLNLMQKFSLSPKQLSKVYQALIEKGLLTEFEYHYLRGIPPVVSEVRIGGPNLGETAIKGRTCEIRGMELPRDETCEPRKYPKESIFEIESLSRQRISEPKSRNRVFERSGHGLLQRPVFCPKCRHASDPSSPDTCISCGVIFSKFRQTAKRQEVSVWEPDSRYR